MHGIVDVLGTYFQYCGVGLVSFLGIFRGSRDNSKKNLPNGGCVKILED